MERSAETDRCLCRILIRYNNWTKLYLCLRGSPNNSENSAPHIESCMVHEEDPLNTSDHLPISLLFGINPRMMIQSGLELTGGKQDLQTASQYIKVKWMKY